MPQLRWPVVAPIPVELMLDGRQLTEPRMDVTGRSLWWVESTAESSAFVHVTFEDDGTTSAPRRIEVDPAPAAGRGFGGGTFDLLPDGRGVVYVGTDDALWIAELGSRQPRAVWSPEPDPDTSAKAAAQAPAVSPDGAAVVFMVDQRGIVRRPLALDRAAEPDAVLAPELGMEFCFDPVFSPAGDAVSFQAWSPPDMAWDGACRVDVGGDGAVTTWRPAGAAVQQPGFAPDGTRVCVTDATGWLTVWWRDRPLIPDECVEHAAPTWGPRQRSYAVSPDSRRVAFTRNEGGFGRLCVTDTVTATVTDIGRGVHGQLCWRGERITALRGGARTPTEIVVYREDHAGVWVRGRVASGVDEGWAGPAVREQLVEPELVEVATDDATLFARRYRSAAPAGRTIVWVHGGPTAQWDVAFIPGVAFWGSRGWDVLVVDPRGSSGHGRRYQQALHGEWGALDIDDVAALIAASHARGWSVPTRTVVMGGSSGGLTVLGVLAMHRPLVAAGVAVYPVSDLADLAERSHRYERHYPLTLVGPPGDARYRLRSPREYADRIAGPVLLMHGVDDAVVPADQSVELARRIEAAGGAVELHLFEGEGHGFRQPATRRRELELTEAFLNRTVPAGRH